MGLSRRRIIAAFPVAALCGAFAKAKVSWASSTPGDPKQFMDMFGSPLATIMNNPVSPDVKEKKVLTLVDNNVDIDGIAQYCLGRYWKQATPTQKSYYLKLFHRIVHHSVITHMNGFSGVKYSLGSVQPQDNNTFIVNSTLSFPDKAPMNVGWVVGYRNQRPQVIDVKGGGASLRLTQRNDYVAFLRRNGGDVQVLLNALRKQIDNYGQQEAPS